MPVPNPTPTKPRSDSFAIQTDHLCLVVMPTSWMDYAPGRQQATLTCKHWMSRWESWQFCGLLLPQALRWAVEGQTLMGTHMSVVLVRWPGSLPKSLEDLRHIHAAPCEDILELPTDAVDDADALAIVFLGEALRSQDYELTQRLSAATTLASMCGKSITPKFSNQSLWSVLMPDTKQDHTGRDIPLWPSQVAKYLRESRSTRG